MIGKTLGQYRIVSKLGEGGMGIVYQAVDQKLGRKLAVKVLPAAVTADPDRVARFEREARSAAILNHPNIVTIYAVGAEESIAYIAMEFVEGRSLHDLLEEGPMPMHTVLRIARQLARGLAKAHEARIIHRDLKPGNIMISNDGFVKILDFGLAKLHPSRSNAKPESTTMPSLTEVGAIVGTPHYMSPEQAQGLPVDFRSDQFSLGTILYEMATGKKPFEGNTPMQTIVAVSSKEPEPVCTLNPAAPRALQMLIERCLTKKAQHRFSETSKIAFKLEHIEHEYVAEALHGSKRRVEEEPQGLKPPPDLIVGRLKVRLPHAYQTESPLGAFVADVIRVSAGADVGLVNAGGIHTELPEGVVRRFHVRFALPHLSTLVVCEVNGATLRLILEQGLTMRHGMLQASGVTATFDATLPQGNRLISVSVNGQPIDEHKTYRVATNSFMADGGDSFQSLVGTKRTETGQLLSDVVIAYFRGKGDVDGPVMGRLVPVSGTKQTQA